MKIDSEQNVQGHICAHVCIEIHVCMHMCVHVSLCSHVCVRACLNVAGSSYRAGLGCTDELKLTRPSWQSVPVLNATLNSASAGDSPL